MERFEREESLSIYWFNRANDLRGAAGAVRFAAQDESDQIHRLLGMATSYSFAVACPQVFFMLCGLSLELVFKALILEIGKKPPAIHDLRKLSLLAQVAMSADDLELIDLLSNHISWAGKYPIPKGGKKDWKEHADRMHASLFDRVPNTSIAIMLQNERLNWDDYSRIWEIGTTRYWALYHRHKP